MNIARIYHMRSYRLERKDFIPQSSDLPVELKAITLENAIDVDRLRGDGSKTQ